MQHIVIATHNQGKLLEFERFMAPLNITVVSAGALGLPEPDETGATFFDNAKLKARAAARTADLPALADDSGLCVAALAGEPGVFSARYAGGDYEAACARIIAAAERTGEWRAWFVCALCLAQPDGATATYIGQADGRIAARASGGGGFGYDPIFIPLGYDRTYAELGDGKHAISHRAAAMRQLSAVLAK